MSASTVLAVLAPQFNTYADRDAYLELAELNVNRDLFGVKGDQAVALLAAHYLALNTDSSRQGGGTGQITQKKEGDLSISYAAPQSMEGSSDMALTIYGMQFETLKNSINANIYVLGSGVCLE